MHKKISQMKYQMIFHQSDYYKSKKSFAHIYNNVNKAVE
ncbi:hypothetical protein SA957_0893 [Staphylococcus aureus subsp. aureus SA957]|nr:hypothetical protein SA957_0893 [Staphylococcus aureus subsp. aureus SA957]AGW35923.1 hypothetical protein SA40_0878 [Staphylococcus aureus subsp. aureus SA40]